MWSMSLWCNMVRSGRRRAIPASPPWAKAFDIEPTIDERIQERLNWNIGISQEDFLREWGLTTDDRNYVPPFGRSSNAAGQLFLEALNERCRDANSLVVAVAHGGVTADLARTVAGDALVTSRWPQILHQGFPSCALSRLSWEAGRMTVESVADTSHL